MLFATPGSAEPSESFRQIPPIDPGLLTGAQRAQYESEKAAKQAKLEEMTRERVRLENEIESAKHDGRPTGHLEAELKSLHDAARAVHQPPPWDPGSLAVPALHARLDEIKQIVRSPERKTTYEARRLIDMLYVNIEPRLNNNLQSQVLGSIEFCAASQKLDDDARVFLRNGILDYYYAAKDLCDDNNRGALCSPLAMAALAEAIGSVATSADPEAQDAFSALRRRAAEKCDALAREDLKARVEKRFAWAEDRFTITDDDLCTVNPVEDTDLSEDDVAAVLRTYRRALLRSTRRLAAESVASIDANLVKLADRGLNLRNWELWSDVAIALGPRRASPALRECISRHGESAVNGRLSSLKTTRTFPDRDECENPMPRRRDGHILHGPPAS
jgi:hypothetical protein